MHLTCGKFEPCCSFSFPHFSSLKRDIFSLAHSDVDVTGISENSQNIHVADGSVILQTDDDKYRDTDGSSSEGESDDETEETERYVCKCTTMPLSITYQLSMTNR